MADDQYKEKNKYISHVILSVLFALFCSWILSLLILPITHWLLSGDISLVGIAWDFWSKAFLHPSKIIITYANWIKQFREISPVPVAMFLPFIPIAVIPIIIFVGLYTNPYSNLSTVFGSGRLASYQDIKKMGLFDGFCCVLGRFKGRLLKMPNTLSALVERVKPSVWLFPRFLNLIL